MTDLSDSEKFPPPEGEVPAGYYPDPLGGKYARWWDGSRWTAQVGPETAPEGDVAERPVDASPPAKAARFDPAGIVKSAFELYRRYPLLFFVLGAGVIVPYDLIGLIATGSGPYSRAAASVGAQLILGVGDYILVGPLVSALHVHAVAEIRAGGQPVLGEVAKRGLKVLPVVAATTIMAGLGIALGIIALIVPGVILWLRWFVAAQAAAIDDEGWLPALRRSRMLTAGSYGSIIVFVLLLGIIFAVPSAIVPAVFGLRDTGAVSFLIGLVVHVLTASFGALATAQVYFALAGQRDD